MDKCNGSHEEGRKKLLNRIRRIKGQIRGSLNPCCERIIGRLFGGAATDSFHAGAVGLMMTVLEGIFASISAPKKVSPDQRQEDTEQVISVLRSYVK